MKPALKLSISLLFFFCTVTLFAQANTAPQYDEGMDVFLFVFACTFFAVMIGAAVVGAFLAMLFVLSLLALVSLGIVSTSVFIGLYKRSLTVGFRTFTLLIFGTVCSFLGLVSVLLFNHFIPLHLSTITLSLTGFFAGLVGGLLLGTIVFSLFNKLITTVTRKFLPE